MTVLATLTTTVSLTGAFAVMGFLLVTTTELRPTRQSVFVALIIAGIAALGAHEARVANVPYSDVIGIAASSIAVFAAGLSVMFAAGVLVSRQRRQARSGTGRYESL